MKYCWQYLLKLKLIPFLLIIIFIPNVLVAQKADSLEIKLNKTAFTHNDTISFEVSLKGYSNIANAATLNVWKEQLKTGRKWQFRYPFINGSLAANLTIGEKIKKGAYAVNFLLQKTLFTIWGNVNNASRNDTLLNYFFLSKNNQSLSAKKSCC